jgi:DNA-binding NtrC family response regulator
MSRTVSSIGPHQAPVEPLPGIIGSSAAMLEMYRLTRQVARSRASVLLLGETGTGKELIAHAIHELSQRRNRPFVRVNCGALSENLLESELFGHVRGAFTGAIDNRTGRFEAAHTGTIFLDEINSTTPHLQVKLLRALQEREFERVGDTQTIRVDTRVIAASNRDLLSESAAGRFREDLYYRLNVVPIHLPPLRDRREDIPELVAHFLDLYNEQNDRYVAHIEPRALAALQQYQWPGNVRELQNYVERAVVMAPGDELRWELLPPVVTSGRSPRTIGVALDFDSLAEELVHLGLGQAGSEAADVHSRIVDRVEREVIAQVLHEQGGVQIKAASRLGINRNTLHKKLKQYGLENNVPLK